MAVSRRQPQRWQRRNRGLRPRRGHKTSWCLRCAKRRAYTTQLEEAECALTGQHETLVHESRNVELDLGRRELLVRGVAADIGDRAFDIFALLMASRGELVSKDEIIRHLWSGAAIGDNALDAHISALRKALGAERGLLKTAYGRGYRVVGAWTTGVRDASRNALGSGRSYLPVGSNLPLPASSLVGRDADGSAVTALLAEHRLITLVGTGGIGKTRLALDVAHRLLGQQSDGVWMVELGALSDPAMVPVATAAALGIDISNNEALEAIARFMKGKRLVLVLDTCEHLVAAAAQLAETLLGHSAGLRILATSREPLRAEGERLFAVSSLSVPVEGAPVHQIASHSAVQLFLARAAATGQDFPTDAKTIALIGIVCRRLDGIPLALELAAARSGAGHGCAGEPS